MLIPQWDRAGLERLVRYCARPPMSGERLAQLNDTTLVYSLRKPTLDGRTELVLTPLELLDHLSKLITPPRIHKHRYCGVLAPNATLRKAVIASAGPSGATAQLLQEARNKTGLQNPATPSDETTPKDEQQPPSTFRRAAARSWALLLVRIYECLPLLCPNCFAPMRIIAFIEEPAVVESILRHIGEPTIAPEILPARASPQAETAGMTDETWN